MNICNWALDEDDGSYATSCVKSFIFIDGTPEDNSFKFCPYCSKAIAVKKPMQYEEPDDWDVEQDATWYEG